MPTSGCCARRNLGSWADAGKLQPVSDSRLQDPVWTSMLPLYREKLLVWGELGNHRAAYAYPLLGEAPLLCWRSDVVGAADRREPPETWTELRDQAAALFAETGKPPLPPLPENDEELERLFYTVAASYVRRALSEHGRPDRANDFAFHFDLETGEPLINKDGFVRALELLQELQAFRPAKTGRPDEAFRLAKGPTVFCVTDAAYLASFRDNPIGMGPVPGATRGNRVPYLGSASWIGMVPKTAPQGEAAFDLLADIAGPETSNQLALALPHRDPAWGGGLLRTEQFDTTVRLESFELRNAAAVEELRKTLQWTLHSGAQNPVLPLRIPDQQRYRPVLIRQLHAALGPAENRPTAKAALDMVAEEWKRIGAESDLTKRKKAYQTSVGL